MIRKIGVATAAGMLALAGTVVAGTPAQADTPGCVDSFEWRKTSVGDGKLQTEHRWDTRGRTVWSDRDTWVKKYVHCGVVYSYAKVKYKWTGARWVIKNGKRW